MGNSHGKMKHAKAPIKADHLRKLQLVIEYVAKGWTQHEIAKEMGLSQPQICKLWKQAQQAAHERAAESAQDVLDQEIRHLDVLRRSLFRAWERSQEDAEATEKTKGKSGKLVVSKQTRKGQAGDAALAGQLLKIHERMCKLKGLDVERLHVEGGLRWAGQSPEDVETEMLSRLRRLVQERKAVAGSGGGGNGNE